MRGAPDEGGFEIHGREKVEAIIQAYKSNVCCFACGRAYDTSELWDDWKRIITIASEGGFSQVTHRGLTFKVYMRCFCPGCKGGV